MSPAAALAVVEDAFVEAGTVVTCEAGHRIYRVANDLGRRLRSADFIAIHPDIPDPRPGHHIGGRCPCGKPFARRTGHGGHQFHFEGLGWRP